MSRRLGTALAAIAAAASTLAVTAAAPASNAADPVARPAIIGGKTADPSQWSFIVALRSKGEQFCGGSVIAPTVVLTAAHCANAKPRRMVAVIGRPKLGSDAGEVIRVTQRVVHPDYKKKERHDLALMFLARPTTVTPVALASPEVNATATTRGSKVRAAGWGAKDVFQFTFPRFLKSTVEWIRQNKRCERTYEKQFTKASMICSFGRFLGESFLHSTICSGDSGGPLVSDTPTGPVLVGVSSFGGFICGWDFTPTVYARVSHALPFIERYSGVLPPPALPVTPPAGSPLP